LGYNRSNFGIRHDLSFIDPNNPIKSIESPNTGGIHLGIMANWQISKHLDLRGYPLNLIFSDKQLRYTKNPTPGSSTNTDAEKVNSILMSFPLQLRLKSDRIGNFLVYTLAGMKYDYDLASNAGGRNTANMVTVKKSDYGVEGGIGFQFFFPYFILSPEIKFSYGLSNVHSRDELFIYSSAIDRMNSRMVMFSLHFEGGGLGGRRN
jgi:hypothetical protein